MDFDLEYLIASTLKIITPMLKGRHLELFYEFEEGLTTQYRGDPTRIRQVIFNLLSNAIKFTEQGSITISVQHDPSFIADDGKERKLLISVKDTGIGISSEKQKMIFSPFVQADSSITRRFGGSGLGLFIVKNLVEKMGGKVVLESEAGKGSIFSFTVILGESQGVVSQEVALASLRSLAGKKTLIIDDNPDARRILSIYCHEYNIAVAADFSSAEQALAWLAQQSALPDFIVCDTLMPGMDGYAFAEAIKKEERFKAMRLLCITSDALPGAARKAHEVGFDAFLAKPIVKRDFLRVLQAFLGDRRLDPTIITKHLGEEIAIKGAKILVVEDNPVNLKLAGVMLSGFGCQMQGASNGQEAIDELKKDRYDLILMDMQMPVMGGIEATRIIREHINKQIPIIGLTAAATKEDEESALQAGMNDYLTKPVNATKLKEKIAHYLQ